MVVFSYNLQPHHDPFALFAVRGAIISKRKLPGATGPSGNIVRCCSRILQSVLVTQIRSQRATNSLAKQLRMRFRCKAAAEVREPRRGKSAPSRGLLLLDLVYNHFRCCTA